MNDIYEKLPQQAKAMVDEFAADADIKALVTSIEGRIATTQNHYGDYGAALSRFSHGSKATAIILAVAMFKAGGNEQGIRNGLKLFT